MSPVTSRRVWGLRRPVSRARPPLTRAPAACTLPGMSSVTSDHMIPDLRGVVPPLVSPFTAAEEPDPDALRREVRHHLDIGVHGLCVTGSTGDGQMLSVDDSVA